MFTWSLIEDREKVLDLLKRDGYRVRVYDRLIKNGDVPEQVDSLEEGYPC